jgi:hypothetical protein
MVRPRKTTMTSKLILWVSPGMLDEIDACAALVEAQTQRGKARRWTRAEFVREAVRVACRDLRAGKFFPRANADREDEVPIYTIHRPTKPGDRA